MRDTKRPGFHMATPDELRAGEITDVYFQRAVQVLQAAGISKQVTAEVTVSALPTGYDWGVLAGVEEVCALLAGLPVDVHCAPEGSLLFPEQPVLRLSGEYTDFAVYETALLGLLCQASGVATKAARCRQAAGEKGVFSFGARRMHPAVAPMIERSAYLGGCDGVAVVKSAELIGRDPVGTMPHALTLLVGDAAETFRLFDKYAPPEVPRICLVDTLNDEKVEAIAAAEVLGERLTGVRLDTPGSRKGDMRALLREVRWELDLRGYQHVKLLVSGGLDEHRVAELVDLVDAFGIGTAISNAPVLNFALDIVEVGDKPLAKRGKRSGVKDVWRCPECLTTRWTPRDQPVTMNCSCPPDQAPEPVRLLTPLLSSGELVRDLPPVSEIRDFVLSQLATLAGRMSEPARPGSEHQRRKRGDSSPESARRSS